MRLRGLLCVTGVAVLATAAADISLAPIATGPNRNPSPLNPGFARIGTIRPRAADEIARSNLSLGCECLDRDFAIFDEYKDYIVPLGIKEIRLFAGWAKCEREPGRFNFAWLDHCVDWAVAHGINVYLDVSYGNPIYKGAGGAGLANGTPNTPEGLSHWDDWIAALGAHYRGRIRDYAMWNEPDNGGLNSPAVIADLNVRTARILRRLQPDCRLHGLSLGSNSPELFEKCLIEISKLGGIELFDAFVYHGYAYNPDSSYARVEELIRICAKYAPKAKMRQGENGCISEWSDRFALAGYPWSENSQAKWNMRRMIGDLGHGCPTLVYSICDLQYGPPYAPYTYLNRKGLLRANADRQVYAVKKAYYAVQNVAAVFDAAWSPVRSPRLTTIDRTLACYEFVKNDGTPLFAFWDRGHTRVRREPVTVDAGDGRTRTLSAVTGEQVPNPRAEKNADGFGRPSGFGPQEGVPGDSFVTRPAVLDWAGAPLKDPVWVDLFTGAVYAFPAKDQIRHSRGVTFVRVPVYDSPCLLTERVALDFSPAHTNNVTRDRGGNEGH